jgi:hypothetical protein
MPLLSAKPAHKSTQEGYGAKVCNKCPGSQQDGLAVGFAANLLYNHLAGVLNL